MSARSPESLRRVSPEKLAQVAQMLEDQVSHKEISRTLRVSEHTIRRHFPGTGWEPQQAGRFTAAIRGFRVELPGGAR